MDAAAAFRSDPAVGPTTAFALCQAARTTHAMLIWHARACHDTRQRLLTNLSSVRVVSQMLPMLARAALRARAAQHRVLSVARPLAVARAPLFGEPAHKSASCYGKATGEPLTAYPTEQHALEGAAWARARSGLRLDPYHCHACGQWHLAPRDRHTPSVKCACLGASGEPKSLFASREHAQRRANILKRERGVSMSVYPCELGLGWHLTRGWALHRY